MSLLFPTVICLLDGTNICCNRWSGYFIYLRSSGRSHGNVSNEKVEIVWSYSAYITLYKKVILRILKRDRMAAGESVQADRHYLRTGFTVKNNIQFTNLKILI